MDTLICSVDTLQLKAFTSVAGAVFSWSPSYNIIGTSTNQPFVYPKKTTTYNVAVSYKGCFTNDSVKVNVIDDVSLIMPHDTTICATDNVQLVPSTNGLYFVWSPPDGLSDAKQANPLAAPLTNTDYKVVVSVGKCVATDDVHINVVPFPVANAGSDLALCFGKTTQLHAAIEGSSFYWTPTTGLLDPNSLSTVVGPQSTTQYVLHVMDTLGCPKPATDSILVKVIPKVQAFAGNDTTVVREQTLQLNATGGTNYQWTPSSNLSDPFIANPVATLIESPDTLLYTVKVSTPEGCSASDSIKIYVFDTEPQVFVPTAFTPNGDGKNDIYRTTIAGMKQFLYFRVYNRWGQLLFGTSEANKGWDGTYNGKKQESGTYVYSIQAIDYNNKSYFKKGTFVLIR
jgi:gliding motility-associated-like protein